MTVTSAEFDSFKQQVPSNEDLVSVVSFDFTEANDPGRAQNVFIAPYDCTILGCTISTGPGGDRNGSDSDYFTAQLNKKTGGTFSALMARRTTEIHGTDANGGITQFKGWDFAGAAWTNRDLSAGDTIQLNLTNTGNPGQWPARYAVAIRYQRKAA